MGKSRRYMEDKLDEIQEFSELGDAFYQPVNTYSSGLGSRLGFSIALQTDPEVFLIDEVLSVGDHAFSQKSRDAIRKKFRPETTVILISHEARMISEVCTRAVWMNRGEILAAGDPASVCETYENSQPPKPRFR
jgi:ABC-type polysaccharide/polyol phosphate transport system ATPase subunit